MEILLRLGQVVERMTAAEWRRDCRGRPRPRIEKVAPVSVEVGSRIEALVIFVGGGFVLEQWLQRQGSEGFMLRLVARASEGARKLWWKLLMAERE